MEYNQGGKKEILALSYTQDYSVPNIPPALHPQLQYKLLDIPLVARNHHPPTPTGTSKSSRSSFEVVLTGLDTTSCPDSTSIQGHPTLDKPVGFASSRTASVYYQQ